MMIIAEEWPNEMKHGKATEKWHGDYNPRIHETSTTWKIPSLTRTIDRAREEDSHLEEEEGEEEEDLQDSWITIQGTRTSIVSIMEEGTTLKGAQKLRRTSREFSKKKLWWASHPQCRTRFAQISGSHSSWTLNQVRSPCSNFNSHNHIMATLSAVFPQSQAI
jgi:hypothetical protein